MNVFKKAALLTTALLTAAVAAGCADSAEPAAGGAATTSPAVTDGTRAAAETERTSDPGDTDARTEPTSDPGDNGAQIGDAGDGGNWLNAVEACPNKGQQPEIQKLIRADVTGDGVDDALVARTCEQITSRWPSVVEVFDGATPEKPRRLGVLLEDAGVADHPWFVSLKVSGTVVTVKAHGVSEQAPQACPDLKLTYTYEYKGGGFTRAARKAERSADCLPLD